MDPATIASIGQFASGAGSLLSGLGLGSKKSDPVATQAALQDSQGRHELYMQKASFDQKMQLAKDHGLHPLVMAGVPLGGYSPSISVSGGDSGSDPAMIGQGINQISRSFVKPPEEDAEISELNMRILRANAKRAEWEALGTEFRVAEMAAPQIMLGQPGNPPGTRASNDVVNLRNLAAEQAGISPSLIAGGAAPITMKQDILPPHPNKLGHAAGTDQAFITVMDAKGKPTSVLNQQAIQAEFEAGATMTWLTKTFGAERAIEIMAALEQKGLFGAAAAAALAGGKLLYDRLGSQAREADKRRGYGPGRGRSAWRAAPRGRASD